ncbi:MAG: methylated-DNA--[protein]-cysteine S-methyltransferase [Nitrococcus sp.]|nr:methylated-DNA--[protein]-cysteine S-methyltransferase [Nitrococcus sp.]
MNEQLQRQATLARGASRDSQFVSGVLGMTPGQYRAGGAGMEISHASAKTPLGMLMMAATDRGLCFIQLGDGEAEMRERLRAEYPAASISVIPPGAEGLFRQWIQALRDYLEGSRIGLDLPSDIWGTPLQMKVWDYLRAIPYGEVRTYKQVAESVGRPRATRAVANACAANRLALTVPCHRVIRGDGGLGGYRWGLERKRALLERERVARAETTRDGG